MTSNQSVGRRRLRAFLLIALSTVAYLLAAGWMAYISRDQINPDGVGYIQAARNYASGRFDLAVTSWWSPLLSWILIIPARLTWELPLTVKVIGVLSGIVMAWGAACLVKGFTGGRGAIITYAIGLAMSLATVPDPVTPDLLTAAILTCYFVASRKMLADGTNLHACCVGLLGGLAFLSKAYCLPFVLAHLLVTFAIRVRQSSSESRIANCGWTNNGLDIGDRTVENFATVTPKIAAKQFAMACAVALLAAAPWAMVISLHDGQAQISSVGSPTIHGFTPAPIPGKQPLPLYALQKPRDGRITSWENPVEIAKPWPNWKLTSPEGLKTLAVAAGVNATMALGCLRVADFLGLTLICLIIAAISLFAGKLPPAVRTQRLWACLSILIYLGGYILIVIYERYVWAVWPLMLAVAIDVIFRLKLTDWTHKPVQSDAEGIAPANAIRRFQAAMAAVLFLSACGAAGMTFDRWAGPTGQGVKNSYLRQVSADTLRGQTVSNEWHQGLFAAFWARATYLGRFDGRTPADIADELKPFGPTMLVIFDDDLLCERLLASPRFREVQPTQDVPNTPDQSIRFFRFDGQP